MTSDVAMALYKRIKDTRGRLDITQAELAKRVGVPQPRLSEMETRLANGDPTRSMELLFRVVDALGLQVMFVPAGAYDEVKRVVTDWEIVQDIGSKSIWDELYDEAEAFEDGLNP